MKILPVSFRVIFEDSNSERLFAEYGSECALPELAPIAPQPALYEAMEASGGLQAFAVYDKEKLVGFLTVLIWTVPHYGKKIGSNADIFLSAEHRASGTGAKMIALAEGYARSRGAVSFQWTVPVGSRFGRLLALNVDQYRRTNIVYLRVL